MRTATQIARILTGMLFAFSGFVKGIDPMGTAFRLEDYFRAAGMDFGHGITVPLAMILCLLEFAAGMMLLTGSLTRLASWMAALFMAFFTPLTLVLALFNPVTDCGCFGDAIHLTNWQTFFKNILIIIPVIFIFIRREDRSGTTGKVTGILFTSFSSLLFILFMAWNILYLPVIDFRPYRPGADLAAGMAIPPGAPADRYDIRFIYEKNGEQKEFTLTDYPANDTAWKFIDQKSVLVSKGYVPPIHDFTLVTAGGQDMTGEITGSSDYVLLVIAGRLSDSNSEGLRKAIEAGEAFGSAGRGWWLVTSTSPQDASSYYRHDNILFADETTLKTVIRANPGFVMLRNGTVMAQWSFRNLPPAEAFGKNPDSLALKSQAERNSRLIYAIASLAVLLLAAVSLPFRNNSQY